MLFIVRISCLFVWASIFTVTADAYSQSKKFTVSYKDITMEEVINRLEKSSEFSFFYTDEIDLSRKVDLEANNMDINELLQNLFSGTNLTYKVIDKQIIIYRKNEDKAGKKNTTSVQQGIRITGSVSDKTGELIPGVTIIIRGSTIGTTTDTNGEFSITVPSDTSTLQFRFIGYQTQDVIVGKRKIIAVTLEEAATSLEEVTIVAFGTQKKESVTSSISTIAPGALKVNSSNLTTAFTGKLSGIISYQTTGEPGQDNADFFIRGITTFGANTEPLILIDNIELTKQDLARLQPDDIESFSIMKDATATALYGARGANGVIYVKTKTGVKGKAKLNLRIESSLSQATKEMELADATTYMKMHNEAWLTRYPNEGVPYTNDKIDRTIPGSGTSIYPATDWRNEMLRKFAVSERANLSVTGGGDIARYYVAASFSQDNGILKNDINSDFKNNVNFLTYTLRSNVNIDLTKTTELIVRLSGNFEDYRGPIGSYDSDGNPIRGGTHVYNLIMRSNPVRFPAYYPKDEEHKYVGHTMFGNSDVGQYLNPYAEMVKGFQETGRSNLAAQMELHQKLDFLTKGLLVRGMVNITRASYYEMARESIPFYYKLANYNYYTGEYNISAINPDTGTEYLTYDPFGIKRIQSTMYVEAAVNYSRDFDKHSVGGLLVFQLRDDSQPNATTLHASLPYRNIGLSGRFTYGYSNRYFAELNFGYNGSERFDKKHRFGFFPSAGLGWLISNESFFEAAKETVSNLKLRASYGLVGNDKIGNDRFLYISNVTMTDATRGSTFGREGGYYRPGISIQRYADPDITWETAEKVNLALELGLYKGVVNLVAEVYKENRRSILQTRVSIPASMGLWQTPQANIGEAKGKGIDLHLDVNKYFNKDFWVQVQSNFTYATSEFTKYEEFQYSTEWWKQHIGYSVKQSWGYLAEGLFIDDLDVSYSPRQFGDYAAGDIKYRDVNGDGQITSLDQVPLGYPTVPEINYGFGVSAGWKNFDASFFFSGIARKSFWINYGNVSPFFQSTMGTGTEVKLGENALGQFIADSYWSEDSRNAYAVWPRLSPLMVTNNGYTNSWFMRNGSFLRLKQAEIGYSLPERWINKFGLQKFRVYLSGTNLLCFSAFKIWDPEMGGNGLGYPLQRVYNIGINLNF